ncbi:MAG: GNAT family N-acetyltransferase [Anaerolineae bacterium]|nr:GNAT family N-acetyltransferase [Anaerolineae bacterium]MDW8098763.1 GNAT family N-acetyltransferase [Anaerolineae bacterium]
MEDGDRASMRMGGWELRILETPEEMREVEELQRQVWPGSDADIVPAHLLVTAAHNGGLVVGAFAGARLVGFVFGFPGLDTRVIPPRLKHCSHMLGVHPDYRDAGIGFALKRAQWQIVRHQGIDRVTWTYDPLLSRNAYLNIAKLGAVCDTYLRNVYGKMRDAMNAGLPSDRFQVDWWVHSPRVEQRMSGESRPRLGLAQYLEAGAALLNPSSFPDSPVPPPPTLELIWSQGCESRLSTVLVEIPSDFLALKAADPGLALVWRLRTRALFEALFARGFIVTDFLYESGPPPRSLYVLSLGTCTIL